MKRKLITLVMMMLIGIMTQAQVSGTYTIGGTEFPTISFAILTLNTMGVGDGGAIFDVPAGYTETFTTALDGVITTTSSTAQNPIIFRKSGTGPNPLIIAGVGTNTNRDAIFALGGTDYVTFDGINIKDNPANSTTTTQMEFGFWLARAGPNDGTQHVTIKNCKVFDFKRNYLIGSTNHTLNYTAVTPASSSGTNSYNKIINDSLVNTAPLDWLGTKPTQRIYLTSASNVSTSGFYDASNEIGVEGGNTLLNCVYIDANYQKDLKVANNLFTSVDNNSVSTQYHIKTTSGRNTRIQNNLIGNFNVLSSNSYKAIYDKSTDSVNIIGNQFININHAESTTASFTAIECSSSVAYGTISGNLISNVAFGGFTTSSGIFCGINVSSGNMVSNSYFDINNNFLTNNYITCSSSTVEHCFIKTSWYGWSSKVYDNIISNNFTVCNGVIIGIDARTITANMVEKRIYHNKIDNMNNDNGSFYGIRHAYGLRAFIYQNQISRVSLNGNSSPVFNGITIENNSTAASYIFNNYIYDITTPHSNGNRQVTGLNADGGQLIDIYHNTVYLDAESSSSFFGTAGIYANTSSILKIRNNNIINVSVPEGSGSTVALWLGSTILSNFDLVSNNNNYYTGVPGPNNLIFFDGTNADQTLTAYQTRVMPAENASVTGLISFVNVSTSPYNCRIDATIGSVCESGGCDITTGEPVIDDFYNTPRFPNPGYPVNPSFPPIKPDIGAEEFGGIWSDQLAPNVTLSPLPNTGETSSRTLSAYITDLTGVPTYGNGMPVLYWRINSSAWNVVTATYMTGNQYDFTFGSGVVPGDTVKYYIVAQDLVNSPETNVGSTPIGGQGFSINPPACSTPPSVLFSYMITSTLCGTFNVGSGGDYPTLTAAVNALNNSAISCPVTLLLTDATYGNETFPITINRISGLSQINTLTIKPAPGVIAQIAGSHPESIIVLNGANYVIIDGSNSGGTDRSLLLSNSNTGEAAKVIYLSNPGGFNTATSNCIIKNCKIKSSPQLTNNTYAIVTKTTTSSHYSNIIIQNNEILAAKFGVRIQGSIAYPAKNCKIINNIIGASVDTLSMQRVGIFIQNADNTLIEGNDVTGPSVAGNNQNGQVGIWMYSLATNSIVTRNKVHGFYNNTTYYGAMGIQFRAESNTVTEISNNVIYDIKGPGSQTIYQDIAGISILNGGNVKIWNNSINLEGNVLSTTSDTKSGCIVTSNAVNNLDIRNNILKNSLMPVSGVPGAMTYGIYSGAPASAFTSLDRNDYYINGVGGNIGRLNNTTDYPTLNTWQNATGKDANSQNVNPLFTSSTYLVPTETALNNLGEYLPSLPVDLPMNQRNNPSDMGAYEFGNDPFVITLSSNSVTTNSANITGASNPAGGTVTTHFDYGTTTSYGISVSATPPVVNGTTTTPIQTSLAGLNYGTTYHYRARTVKTNGMISYGADSTFTTLPLVPFVITTAATAITPYSAYLNGTVNPNGGAASVTIQWGLTDSYGNTVPAIPGNINGHNDIYVYIPVIGLTPYTTYHYRVVATNISGTTFGNDMTFITEAIPSVVTTELPTQIVDPSATLNGTVNPNYAPTNMTFEWGLTNAYGNIANATPYTVTGYTTVPVLATITGLTQATEYHYRCVGNGPGGTVYGADQMFISDCPLPAHPGTISGPQSVCKMNTGIIYSIVPIPNTSDYDWTVPAGATIVSGDNTHSITVDFSSNAVSGNVTVIGNNSCGNGPTSSLEVIVHELPVPTISGPLSACFMSNDNVYTTEAGNTDYEWIITGGSIIAGAGTNAITVLWNTMGTKNISVTYTSPFGCDPVSPASISVTVESLDVPTITGNELACEGSIWNVYTTEMGLDLYTWTVSNGGIIASGQGTYQIEVNWNVAGNQTVTVDYEYANGCSPLTAGSLAVEVIALPGAAGPVTGTQELCAGTNGVSYSITPVPGALGYEWTLPAGAAIVSGQNTNSIIVDFAMNAVSGNISVVAQNNCGSGAPSPLYPVTVNPIPATPSISVDENFLLTSSATTGNQWYFNGVEIPGANGQTYQAEEEGAYYVVVTLNDCSSEPSNVIEITFTGMDESSSAVISIYPVPNDGSFMINFKVTCQEHFSINVFNSLGINVYEKPEFVVENEDCLTVDIVNPNAGIYTVVIRNESKNIIKKILVTR